MRITIENIVIVLSLILTEAWFLNGYFSGNPEYEPALAFIIALGALFAKDKIKERLGLSDSNENHDLGLFGLFQHEFPAEPTLRLLKETDFGGSFHRNEIQPLYNFVDTWDSVEKEFINKRLEKSRKALYIAASNLAREFVTRTVPVGNGEFISVFPDNLRGSPRPQHVIDDAKNLNREARRFVPQYEAFVRKCRAILKS